MSDAGRVERDRLAERLVVELGATFHQRAIYPSSHPQVARSIERAIEALDAWCDGLLAAEVSIILLEDQLLVDREPLPEDATWKRGLVHALERLSLSGVTLARGLDAAELAAFLDGCAEGEPPPASRHIQFGRAAYFDSTGGASTEPTEGAGEGTAARIGAEQLGAARAELEAMARGAALRVERLRGLIARLARAAAPARLELAALDPTCVADAAFRHGLAVALGTLRLGRQLDLEGDPLEELGLAGLLHDIGYLEPGADGELSTHRRRLHTVRGAARLAATEGVRNGVAVATYEHHLRFDGGESYPRFARRPPTLGRRAHRRRRRQLGDAALAGPIGAGGDRRGAPRPGRHLPRPRSRRALPARPHRGVTATASCGIEVRARRRAPRGRRRRARRRAS